jgi:hypothetical protein
MRMTVAAGLTTPVVQVLASIALGVRGRDHAVAGGAQRDHAGQLRLLHHRDADAVGADEEAHGVERLVAAWVGRRGKRLRDDRRDGRSRTPACSCRDRARHRQVGFPRTSAFQLSTAAEKPALDGVSRSPSARRDGRPGGCLRLGQDHAWPTSCRGSTEPMAGRILLDDASIFRKITLSEPARQRRAGLAGRGAVQRHRRGEHRLRRDRASARARGSDRSGGEGGLRPRLHPRHAAGLRHDGRRERRPAFRRAAPAPGDRPRAAEERAGADPRRGDVGARFRIRAPGPGRAREP